MNATTDIGVTSTRSNDVGEAYISGYLTKTYGGVIAQAKAEMREEMERRNNLRMNFATYNLTWEEQRCWRQIARQRHAGMVR